MYPAETAIYHAILAGALVLLLFTAGFVFIILHYHKKRKVLHKLRMTGEINALEKERARIAGDLHDDLGSSLSAIKLQLQALAPQCAAGKETIGASERYIDEALLKLKRISFNLMPRVLERKGLGQALHELADMTEQAAGIKIQVCYDCPLLANETTVHIYRIVQEALNNIIKHSGATKAVVELKAIKGKICSHINDNGGGFDKHSRMNSATGQGLQNICARTDVLNANMYLTTAPGCGTDYLIQIPLTYDASI